MRYIDADALIELIQSNTMETWGKGLGRSWWSHSVQLKDNIVGLIKNAPTVDVVEVVRCSDCAVPHNRWTGCPNLNGLIPPPNFYCARGERKQPTNDATDINDGDKPPCRVCEKITEANKDIFWVFARTHQPGTQEEFHRVPVRFCPVCGREISAVEGIPENKKEDGH